MSTPDTQSSTEKPELSSIEDPSNDPTTIGSPHLSGTPLALCIFALCTAVFCVALDNTIIATAIPRITDDFHALQDVGWYGSAYLLTTCGTFFVYVFEMNKC
jgi:hypothetical protein